MDDTISRQAAIDAVNKLEYPSSLVDVKRIIVDLPSVKRTGHWILWESQRQEDVDNDNYVFVCSECGKADIHSKAITVSFCWNCGADMRGADDE